MKIKNVEDSPRRVKLRRERKTVPIRYIGLLFFCGLFCTYKAEAQPLMPKDVSFYRTPLVCGADESIGCGARSKPLLRDLESSSMVKEAWLNRAGTIIAVVWESDLAVKRRTEVKLIFSKHTISSVLLESKKTVRLLLKDFRQSGKWYRGSAVDSLSLVEAATMTSGIMSRLKDLDKHSSDTIALLQRDLAQYIGSELIGLQDISELEEPSKRSHWRQSIIGICEHYLGKGAVSENQLENQQEQPEEKKMIRKSTITCPYCGHKKLERLSDEYCLLKYDCEKCKRTLTSKKGDCCVFCSYGTVKCPSMQ